VNIRPQGMDVTDGDALLRAIIAEPGEDLPRLVYADWLDEVEDSDRSELIRIQIKMAHGATDKLLATQQRLLGLGGGICQLRRDWALPAAIREDWPHESGGWEWHRGFPEVWHCPLALWQAHGTELRAAGPITQVLLIDREPYTSPTNTRTPRHTWFRDDPGFVQRPGDDCLLPPALFEFLEEHPLDFAMFDHCRSYPARAEALNALSDACLQFALRTTRPSSGPRDSSSEQRGGSQSSNRRGRSRR
jgi:uncharacterized protein (TIGR02996 family)